MEKRNARTISSRESWKLNLHLMVCKLCKVYSEKLAVLDKIFQKTFSEKKTEIDESEIQDFKNKVIKKLNF
ncbi:hypothetical protein [Chryseobacterium sp. Tr-659]|uniref:hypothetical protein n=1 Tax=Chryseobacterium sp. Tr-659 TaxID=2608340 RepID=UPI001E47680E|nr:hypothetical protein [Chryseobacterium sp. Tr-659]